MNRACYSPGAEDGGAVKRAPGASLDYEAFLRAKVAISARQGMELEASAVHPVLMPHQAAIVQWGVHGGRRGIFASFGLGKTLIQLEILRQILAQKGGAGLIVLPLGVRQEFMRDAALIGVEPRFIRSPADIEPWGIHLTNYETVRDGKLDPALFTVTSLDEASALRGFGGTKTFREFMRLFAPVRYRYVATATPSPNEYIEILSYSAFLGIMDVGEAKTRFFKRDSTRADKLTLHPHKEREFWLWVASWGLFLNRPSDLGPEYSDDGYVLPELDVHWHEVVSDHSTAGADRDGQVQMFRNSAIGVTAAASEKRNSLGARIDKMMELRAEDPMAHRLLWHDLEAERSAIAEAIPGAVAVWGNQDLEERERRVISFSDGEIQELASKPVLLGSGCNFQRHCSWAIHLGIGFKFNDFIQSIHRIHRFLQPSQVRVDLIYTEAEREIRRALEAKWERHNAQTEIMARIIREYGLAHEALSRALVRSIGVERAESSGSRWQAINNDCVLEARAMPADSVGLILTSIPFATQYEYTPSYNDFGHTDDNAHFWEQMDYLTPELLRILQPGRVAAIHIKDRIIPGGLSGLGFQTVAPFHAEAIDHFRRHGFAYLGMKTIVTDVVRENNQTYRLGWTEQCKDGSRMGVGMPEYLLLFRRPPTDASNGYADLPVLKDKPLCDDHGEPAPFDSRHNWKKPIPGTGYSRARWQMDAHGFSRSSGNRLLSSEELSGLPHEAMYKLWRERSLSRVYDFEGHVAVAEDLDHQERLPATFMLFPPHSWHPDVWSDVARMRTLNSAQAAAGREMHLCPLQFDTADRVILQFSMPGEIVMDPFGGIGTVAYCAVKLGRQGITIELNAGYHADAVAYLRAAEAEISVPTLFDLEEDRSNLCNAHADKEGQPA
jgi:DNA modification methylase